MSLIYLTGSETPHSYLLPGTAWLRAGVTRRNNFEGPHKRDGSKNP